MLRQAQDEVAHNAGDSIALPAAPSTVIATPSTRYGGDYAEDYTRDYEARGSPTTPRMVADYAALHPATTRRMVRAHTPDCPASLSGVCCRARSATPDN